MDFVSRLLTTRTSFEDAAVMHERLMVGGGTGANSVSRHSACCVPLPLPAGWHCGAVPQCNLLGHGFLTHYASVLASVEIVCRQFFLPLVSISLVSLFIPPPANARLGAGGGRCAPVDLLCSNLRFAFVLASTFTTYAFPFFFSFSLGDIVHMRAVLLAL